MTRLRIHFAKRDGACFVPHVEMPPLLCRSARRAGLIPIFTEGMSPHPHVTLGPPLPIGVVGLEEPAELWFENWTSDKLDTWRAVLPEGLDIVRTQVIEEGKALSRICHASRQLVYPRREGVLEDFARAIREELGEKEAILSLNVAEGALDVMLGDPNRYGPGALVKALTRAGRIEGWSDLFLVRLQVGGWDGERVVPL